LLFDLAQESGFSKTMVQQLGSPSLSYTSTSYLTMTLRPAVMSWQRALKLTISYSNLLCCRIVHYSSRTVVQSLTDGFSTQAVHIKLMLS
jgi:hypothetical protein